MPGPWTPSFGSTRCQNFQPFVDSAAFVAEAEMLGISPPPAPGATWADSPENAGPIRPTILSVLMACWASATAFEGSPWLSYSISSIFTAGLVLLYSSMTSFAPFLGG